MLKKVLYLLAISLFFSLSGNIRADNDIEWERIPMPTNHNYMNSKIIAAGKYLFLGSAGISRYNTETGIWDIIAYPIGANCLIGCYNSQEIYSIGTPIPASWPRYLFKSTDYGANWDTLSRLTNATYGEGVVHNNGQLITLKQDDGPIVSVDSGRTWRFSPHDSINESYVCDLEMDKQGAVYLATTNFFGSVAGVYRSYDTCKTWLGPNAQNGAASITVDQGGRVYLGIVGGPIYYSDNQAASWVNSGYGGEVNELFTASDGTVFAGLGYSNGGVLCSFNRGLTWHRNDTGLSASRIVLSFAEDIRGYIYLYGDFNDTAAIYRSTKPVGITNDPEIRIKDYELSNYPNPFNNSTVISYNLFTPAKVQLAVYNIRGELVKDLINEPQNSGKHSTVLNAASLNSGVYFVKLTTGDQTGVHKLILIK